MRQILTIGLVSALLAACGGSDPEPAAGPDPRDELRDWVDTAEAVAEDKDRRGLLSMISENYADGRGNDREKVGDILRVYFMRAESIALLTSIDEIELMGDTAALVDVTVGMAGTDASALGLSAKAYKFEFELEKPADEWMLIGARWGKVGRDLR